jgi:hypothetical protein
MNEIEIYKSTDNQIEVSVKMDQDTVWLNRQQLSALFDRDVKTIGKHINNVFREGELQKNMVIAKFATTTQHGAIKGKTQTTNVEYYNLDVIISVGYRVKSKQGTLFRQWATQSFVLLSQFDSRSIQTGKLSKGITYEIQYQEAKSAIAGFNGCLFN